MSEHAETPRRPRADAAELGLNDHIIRMSFETEGPLTRPQGAPIDDVEYTVDPEQDRGEFVREKPANRRRQVVVAAGCVLLVGLVVGSLWVMMGDAPSANQAAKAAQQSNPLGTAPGVAQVPASLGGLADKPPASLLPQQVPAKETLAPQPAPAVVLPTAATGAAKAEPMQVAPAKEAEAPAQASTPKAAASVVAQTADAKPKADTGADAAPTVAPKVVVATAPQRMESNAKPLAKPQSTPARTDNAVRQPVKATAPATSRVERIESDSHAPSSDSVKPLVSYTAAQLNLRSFDAGVMTMVSSKTNQPVRYRVGDVLPSGDVIEYLDASSMTVVTNRKVIRITN